MNDHWKASTASQDLDEASYAERHVLIALLQDLHLLTQISAFHMPLALLCCISASLSAHQMI